MEQTFETLKKQLLEKEFSHLNPEQRRAVFTTKGPVLILAGAGSGKTTVLINRIAFMIKYGNGYFESPENPDLQALENFESDPAAAQAAMAVRPVKPWSILAITFTNKAAGELKSRIESRIGEQGRDLMAATFHSACVRFLRRFIDRLGGYTGSFTIYDSDDSQRLLKECLRELNIDDKMFPPRMLLSIISSCKDKLVGPEQFEKEAGSDYRLSVAAKAYTLYQRKLQAANAVDFDDIIGLTVRLFEEHPDVLEYYRNRYRYILVDEYQDTNHAQYRLISLLAGGHHNLCVVGDDDQSIYRFRGANIENILNFEKEFPNAAVIKLEQNYRSTGCILNAANSVIGNNKTRRAKRLWTDKGDGEKVQVHLLQTDFAEAEFAARVIEESVQDGGRYADTAVLYRMNAQSNQIEQYLLKAGIPYRLIGSLKFFERKEIKDMVAYLSVIDNPNDNIRLRRIINEPKRGIGDATVAAAADIAATIGESLYDVLRHSDEYAAIAGRTSHIRPFTERMDSLIEEKDDLPLPELYERVMEETGYRAALQKLGREGESRLENIEELRSNIANYVQQAEEPSLAGFLEEIALYTDLDRLNEAEDAVTLMTIHSAKGLEFDNVLLVGMEEGLFPGRQAIFDSTELEEERRLAYVGYTRAKKRLFLTAAASRMLFGQTMRNKPSRFIGEIDPNQMELVDETYGAAPVQSTSYEARTKKQRMMNFGGGISAGAAPSAAAAGEELQVGDRVRHPKFGTGIIRKATPMGGDVLFEIDFSDVGVKKLMKNFAKLRRSDS